MLPFFDSNPQARVCLGAPVVKVDIQAACSKLWRNRALNASVGELERLLMIDSMAPTRLDDMPLREGKLRSKLLVDVVSASFKVNPVPVGPVVKRIGPSLKLDRQERNGAALDEGMEPEVEMISRQVLVSSKPSWQPRG